MNSLINFIGSLFPSSPPPLPAAPLYTPPVATLPNELQMEIFSYLKELDLIATASVCSKWSKWTVETAVNISPVLPFIDFLINKLSQEVHQEQIDKLATIAKEHKNISSLMALKAADEEAKKNIEIVLATLSAEEQDQLFNKFHDELKLYPQFAILSKTYQDLSESRDRLRTLARSYDRYKHDVSLGTIMTLLNAGANIPIKQVIGKSVFTNFTDFAPCNKLDVIKLLIEAGAKPKDSDLDFALEMGESCEVIDLLLQFGLKPDLGHLCKVVEHKLDFKILDKLVEAGAQPTSKLLDFALKKGVSSELISSLLKAGAKPTGDSLWTAMGRSSSANDYNKTIVEELITAGATISEDELWVNGLFHYSSQLRSAVLHAVLNPSEKTLEHAITVYCTGEEIKSLVDKGITPSEKSLLCALEKHATEEVILTLIECGAKPTAECLRQICGTWGPNIDKLRILIEAGAEPTETILRMVMRTSDLEGIKLILEAGAKPTEEVLAAAKDRGDGAFELVCSYCRNI